MQRLEVSGAVRPIYGSLGVKRINCISFKIVPSWKYKLLPSSVKVLETFLEVTLWNPFQLFRRIPNYVSSNKKAPTLQSQFWSRVQIKIGCSLVRRVRGMLQCCHIAPVLSYCSSVVILLQCCRIAPVLSYCSSVVILFYEILPKTDRCAGALSWRRNQLLVLCLWGGGFPSDRIPKAKKMVNG